MSRYWIFAVILSTVLVASAVALQASAPDATASLPLERSAWPACAAGAPDPPEGDRETLVLYDDKGEFAPVAEVYATLARDLASHFGAAEMAPVGEFTGEGPQPDAIVYVGVTYDAEIPRALIDGVVEERWPVLWMGENLWQLPLTGGFVAKEPAELLPLSWTGDTLEAASVEYEGQRFDVPDGTVVPVIEVTDTPSRDIDVIATAKGARSSAPYVVRTGELWWMADAPLDDAVKADRYLVLADLLFDVLAVDRPERHRALVRLEDIGPRTNPDDLRAAADLLHARGVPFSMAVYPAYVGAVGDADDLPARLHEVPEVVEAIEYAVDRGGTIISHGFTHQYGRERNPLSGRSGEDFEFFHTRFDGDVLVYERPVEGDSESWVRDRLQRGVDGLTTAGLPEPETFEFPHYAASEKAYREVAERFAARYDNSQVFSDAWDGRSAASPHMFSLAAPYLIRDSYGSVVIPETLGYIDADAEAKAPGSAQALLETAETQLVVRDGVAGFFYHPFLGTETLAQAVDGMASLGYEFTSLCDL